MNQLINELISNQLNNWFLLTPEYKILLSDKLIRLVDNAYKKTTLGSFVNNLNDVLNSEWLVLRHNNIDAAIFFRKQRINESWIGYKIQGVGHNGLNYSKNELMLMLEYLLNINGWWGEASGRIEQVIRDYNVPIVSDKELIMNLFPGEIKTITNDVYERIINNKLIVKETIFGKPILKKDYYKSLYKCIIT